MKIIVPNDAPRKSGKALIEAFELIGEQLNVIADKYGVRVSVVAYPEDKYGSQMYVAVSNNTKAVNCYVYHTGEYAKEEQEASVITLEKK